MDKPSTLLSIDLQETKVFFLDSQNMLKDFATSAFLNSVALSLNR